MHRGEKQGEAAREQLTQSCKFPMLAHFRATVNLFDSTGMHCRPSSMRQVLLLFLITMGSGAAAQTATPQPPRPRTAPLRGPLERRLSTLLDEPPFARANWGVLVVDDRGRVLFQRNADRYFVPASNTKLVVSAAAAALLPPDYRVRTSLYQLGTVADGVLQGDLILYGRGDPTFSGRCYGVDTTGPGRCDSLFAAFDAMADSLRAHGIRRITGAVVGDGSYFEPTAIHPDWEALDLNWGYAAPVSGLGFNDNSIEFLVAPGDSVDQPPRISWRPDLGLVYFENRARTVGADSATTISTGFFREPGPVMRIRAEGTVALGHPASLHYVAVSDPNFYAARALYSSLQTRRVAVGGGVRSTTDSMAYRIARELPPIAEYHGRPLPDLIFPILNISQNWFAETLLKILGRESRGEGSWQAGLEVERRFLIDSVRIDSTAFALRDGSGLSAGNLMTPRALVQLLGYMQHHPNGAPFLAALPRSGARGSLQKRLVATPFEGRVAAKTGSIGRVNTLSGYLERPDGRTLVFSVQANSHAVPYPQMLAQIDSIVVEIGKTK